MQLILSRLADLVEKAWSYSLSGLRAPRRLPVMFWRATVGGAHLGELLKLSSCEPWLLGAGISTVIDVGSHTGQFASAIACVLPDARIYAFEPLSDCYERLTRRMAWHKEFRAYCVALGEGRGRVVLNKSTFSEASSLLSMTQLHRDAFPWTAESNPVAAEIVPLDDFLGEMILAPRVLLKVDVQGYEAGVLRGAQRVLESVDYALVEVSFQELYEHQATFGETYELMKDKGLVYAGNLDQLLSPLNGSILQGDALFVRRE